jgi:hypothetical protein
MAPQSRGGQELKKNKTIKPYKGRFLNTQKFFVCYSVAIRVKKLFVEIQAVLL